MNKNIQNVVIVGGGTSGWITAALLGKILGPSLNLTLIESDKIGIIGVGEATIPPIIHLNNALGISEKTFLKETKGTIKLGIEFDNWGQQGDSYMHAFGGIGKNLPFCDFHHTWLRSQQLGDSEDFWRYSLNYQAAKHNKFAKTPAGQGGLEYAYHFDAGLYAKLLSKLSQQQGVKRIEGVVENVLVDGNSGHVTSVQLDSGEQISGDLFIDCTGLKALLIEQTLNTGFIDYSHWLPCDRAVAVPCESVSPIIPYTRSTAHPAGWQWRIPLQHRTGNGLVYCSQYMTDEQAIETLLNNLDGPALGEPKVIHFKTGVRRKQWHKNVVAIGLSSGFFEPLESTNIHLIQTAAIRLIKLFPHQGIDQSTVDEFNRQSRIESDRMRDFIILHYKLNQKVDSPFWQRCQNMDVPDTLHAKMALFADSGRVFREQDELFTEIAWQQVMIGQNLRPKDYHPVAGSLSAEQVLELMKNLQTITDKQVSQWPTHDEFLASLYL
ncbi:FADH2 O2-dependent halogenase I [Pseudoalteromonas ulvae UL12]|uniref:Tryptophan halogenase n=1 Tax=Pseudoalteromonas ulvae TaxID=107327 RepID=A0A244CTC1_PSEDV|nr:tryptophan halogenase family protein [Pseudoalteromonas ulvae]MBE0363238.1 FADH2 O2-dependent halogenase I [Pseudoalteromonas ulvae UL12]OUL58853.1 tryptophan halogenase [Pseudoalteromonas ulvae]